MQQTKTYTAASVAILLVLALLVGSWSYLAVWLGDDIVYGFFWDQSPEGNFYHQFKALDSPWEIFVSQYNHYIVSNGRYIAHWLVQWFIAFGGRTLFSIVNALMYIACAVYVLRLCNMKWNRHPFAMFFTIAILLLSFRTKFTPSCQIGFIWMFTLSAICIDIFLNDRKIKNVWLVPLALFAFLAGWGQEALCLGVAAAMLFYVWNKRFKLTRTQWVVAVSYCLGALVLAIAPSNFARASNSGYGLKATIMYMGLLHRMIYLLVLIVLYIKMTHRATLQEMYRNNAFYVNALIVMLVFNMAIGVYSNRQLFGVEFLSLIIAVRLLYNYGISNVVRVAGSLALCACLVCLCVFNYTYFCEQERMYSDIKEQYDESKDGIIFYDILPHHNFFYAEIPAQPFDLSGTYTLGKLWQYEGGKHLLYVLPTCLKGLSEKKLKTQVVRLDEENFMLINSKHKPAKHFRIHCYNKLGSLKKQIADWVCEPDPKSKSLYRKFTINCEHFDAAITGGGSCVKYISSVDIEY